MKNLFIILLCTGIWAGCFAGENQKKDGKPLRISVEGTQFYRNGKPIFIVGGNTPWDKWNDFGGAFNANFWENHFKALHDLGVNGTRVWIVCDGNSAVKLNADGTVKSISDKFWTNLDQFFEIAKKNEIYIMATMMSFDCTKKGNSDRDHWIAMIKNTNSIEDFIDKYILKFINRYKDNPFLFSMDLCNEPDWCFEHDSIPWENLSNLFAREAAAIHENSKVLVTVGIAMVKYNSETQKGNKFSNTFLQNLYKNTNAYLDFYAPHHYAWMTPLFKNPFFISPAEWLPGADKPVVVGECSAKSCDGHTLAEDYIWAYSHGYAGVFAWTTNGVDRNGGLEEITKGAKGFYISENKLPYQNPNLSSEERAKDLLARLTLKEKATLMCDISEAIPRLGIKKFIWWSEALHGYANMGGVTVFPEPIGMAASFNDELVHKVFDAVSDEARAKYNEDRRNGIEAERFHGLSVWTPNVNIFRDPRWGRGQETYGEDPYLTSRMGTAVVNGLQGPRDARYRKLLACAKHYAVHSGPEWARHEINLNNVSPQDLYETYLPAFKALVQKADVREVMCAYHRFDDEPCCGNNRLMQRILREDWGFKHVVVSDCGAIADFWMNHKTSSDALHSAAKGVIAGTDVECGFGYAYSEIPDAVARGLISEKDVDHSVFRLLTQRFELGEMDNDNLVPWTKIPVSVLNSDQHQKLALEMSRQTMTLLQNKDNILPLNKSVKKIAIIGPNADNKPLMWGSYNGTPVQTVTILDGIKAKLPAGKIIYDKGCDIIEGMITDNIHAQCSIEGKPGIRATYWNNMNFQGNKVATDYLTEPLKLTTVEQRTFSQGVSAKDFSAKYETVYKSAESSEIVFRIEALGKCDLLVNDETVYHSGGSWQVSNIRVPFQVEKGKEYRIELRFVRDPDRTDASLNLTIGKEHPVNYDALLKKLKDVDLVIFAGGISPQLEGEEMPVLLPGFKGGDRTNIELPASQRNCLKALKAARKKIIFVNCSGSAIGLVPETETCDAILQAWYAGESGGQAIADALFGDYNPCGKLPVTFYKSIDQVPDFESYAMKGRTYRYMTEKPLFPFGYGLSYTTFSIGKAIASKNTIQAGDSLTVTIPISNTGKRDGAEVIQIYLRKLNDLDAPIKTLRAFQRVEMKAGKAQNLIMNLSSSVFEAFDTSVNQMKIVPGKYELLYGNSSDDKDLKVIEITLMNNIIPNASK